jgi:two-component system OmpR family sensor kinase
MLLLARLDAGRPLAHEPVDLSRLVVDAASDAHVASPAHRWELALPGEPVTVVGDAARLHQVVANLLANARTHTPPGTRVAVSLSVHEVRNVPGPPGPPRPPRPPGPPGPLGTPGGGVTERGGTDGRGYEHAREHAHERGHERGHDGGDAVVSVIDDGPGIPPGLLPNVFERFARGDTSRSRAAGSTGLGLAIVAAVVEAHEGRADVTSVAGRTAFTVRLPLAQPIGLDPAHDPARGGMQLMTRPMPDAPDDNAERLDVDPTDRDR